MAKLNSDSNSAGRAIIKERMDEILSDLNGVTLKMSGSSGDLYFEILSENGSYGYLLEILCLILHLQRAGNISVKITTS